MEVGGGLRSYTVGGVDVLAGYSADQPCRKGRGQLLMPWPNRIRDGRYTFDGTTYQLPLSEAPMRNAIHGLVRWGLWQVAEQSESRIVVVFRLHPQEGWPGQLDLAVEYELGDHGLAATATATNVGPERAPFGFGAHPYVAIGDQPLGSVTVEVPAEHELVVDEQLVPTGTAPTGTHGPDLRTARRLEDTRLDTAFTGLLRGAAERWEVTVGALEELGEVTVWGDEAFGWVHVFTGEAEDPAGVGSRGVAVEPMSCPADAFNSGDGLVVLEPGQSWSGRWGVTARPSSRRNETRRGAAQPG